MRRRFEKVERELKETERNLDQLRFQRCQLFQNIEEEHEKLRSDMERGNKEFQEAVESFLRTAYDEDAAHEKMQEILAETAKDLEELLKD